MNLNFLFLNTIRILLFPFSLVYGLLIALRNWCFDRKIFSSVSFNLPLICVGNLTVGGTGKSPMVEFLIQHTVPQFQVAVLSRGYKRKTTGYALATSKSTALEIGDEPMQLHRKFPDLPVAVGEQRVEAIPQLLHDCPGTQAILLDDAFQHRSVKAGLNILLTDYNNLFTRDWFLPTGDLRDQKGSYRRADILVVTKCPPDLSIKEKQDTIREIRPLAHQQLFFTCIRYGTPYHILDHHPQDLQVNQEVLLVSGIANPAPLKKYLDESTQAFYEIDFSDHHIFTIDDLRTILRRFQSIPAKNKIILTTEKDAVRLLKFEQELKSIPFFVIPIEPQFLFQEEPHFCRMVKNFIQNFPLGQ